MDETLIIESSDKKCRLDRIIQEECPAIRQLRNGDLWCLGFFGNVYIKRSSAWVDLKIEPSQENNMICIYEFDGMIWSTGAGGTILKFKNDRWADALSFSIPKICIYTLYSRPGEIIAVGDDGFFLSIKGQKASRVDVPTNNALKGVTVLPDGEVLICGDRGTVLVGKDARWVDYSRPDFGVDLYQAVCWRGRTFISAETQILEFCNGELQPVAEVTSFDLFEAGDSLWSVGSKELNYFTDDGWQPFVVEIEIEEEGPVEARPIG